MRHKIRKHLSAISKILEAHRDEGKDMKHAGRKAKEEHAREGKAMRALEKRKGDCRG